MEPEAIWQDGREMGENVKKLSFEGANPEGGPVQITGREQEKCRDTIKVWCRLIQNEGFSAQGGLAHKQHSWSKEQWQHRMRAQQEGESERGSSMLR